MKNVVNSPKSNYAVPSQPIYIQCLCTVELLFNLMGSSLVMILNFHAMDRQVFDLLMLVLIFILPLRVNKRLELV